MTEQQFETIHMIAFRHSSLTDIVRYCDVSLKHLKDKTDDVMHVLGLHRLSGLYNESETAELMQPLFVEIERIVETVKAKAIEEMRQMQLPKESTEVQP